MIVKLFFSVLVLLTILTLVLRLVRESREFAVLVTKTEVEALKVWVKLHNLNVSGFDPDKYGYHYEPGITRPSPEPNADTAKFLRLIEERVKELRQQRVQKPNRITTLRLKSLCHIYEHFSGGRQ